MSTNAATDHLAWRVRIGYTWHDAAGGSYPRYEGYGCMLSPQYVLTSWRVCKAALRRTNDTQTPEPFVEAGIRRRPFRQFSSDERLDLAVLKTDEAMTDAAGHPLTSFPRFSPDRPVPGQAVGILTEQQLHGSHFFPWGEPRNAKYVCFSYGYVTLLKSGKELLCALAGVLAGDNTLGSAVFDTEGNIIGVAVDYLSRHPLRSDNQEQRAASVGYLVFSPITNYRKKAEFTALLAEIG